MKADNKFVYNKLYRIGNNSKKNELRELDIQLNYDLKVRLDWDLRVQLSNLLNSDIDKKERSPKLNHILHPALNQIVR
jgi:hypothetical protein